MRPFPDFDQGYYVAVAGEPDESCWPVASVDRHQRASERVGNGPGADALEKSVSKGRCVKRHVVCAYEYDKRLF